MDPLPVGLVREVFAAGDPLSRLESRLRAARDRGAEVVLLPELPLHAWPGGRDDPDPADAEAPGGPRHELLREAARRADVLVVATLIVADPASGRRYQRALLYDRTGAVLAGVSKAHLPDEEGFREGRHYEPGEDPPRLVEVHGRRLGVQIGSDVHRPAGVFALAAQGAEAILHPRAAEARTYAAWKLVLRAVARLAGLYVLSVDRPAPEEGVEFGGPTLVVDPAGEVTLETTAPVAVFPVGREAVAAARRRYPGCLPFRAEFYAAVWRDAASPRPAAAGASPRP